MAEHQDWHMALELQRRENRTAALLGSTGAGRQATAAAGPAAAAAAAAGAQGPAGERAGGKRQGAPGGQATLTGLLKRQKEG